MGFHYKFSAPFPIFIHIQGLEDKLEGYKFVILG